MLFASSLHRNERKASIQLNQDQCNQPSITSTSSNAMTINENKSPTMMGLFLLGLLSALQFQIVCASIFAATIAPSFLVLAASGILFDAGSMANVDTNSEFERRPPRKPPDKVGASALQTLDLETIEHQSQHRLVAIGRATFPFIFLENSGKTTLLAFSLGDSGSTASAIYPSNASHLSDIVVLPSIQMFIVN